MELFEIKALLDRVEQSAFTEFELKDGAFSLRLSKNKGTEAAAAPGDAVLPVAAPRPAVTAPAPKAEAAGKFVTSPIVGTFYLSAAPGKPPFVNVGDRVKKGQVLCIVEAMKVMNEILSEYDGVVAEVLAENEQMVEFGQKLYRIAEEV